MTWGTIELEPEVAKWLKALDAEEFGRAKFYVDLLEREGVHLGEPYTRHLRGKLRELRFYLSRERTRITYYVTTGRRMILLTVFVKDQRRATTEIDRAERAMLKCVAEGHTAEDET